MVVAVGLFYDSGGRDRECFPHLLKTGPSVAFPLASALAPTEYDPAAILPVAF